MERQVIVLAMWRVLHSLVSALNSQYAASIIAGSAQIPLFHVLPSRGGKGLYLTSPQAMAIR